MDTLKKEEEEFLLDFRKFTEPEQLDYISKNENIVKLSLKNISLQTLPESIGHLIFLEELKIKYSWYVFEYLKTLPESIGNLQNLQKLTIDGCYDFTSLPASFGNLKSLKTLIIKNCNSFGILPPNFNELEQLKKLDLSFCDFKEIPQVLYSLKNLKDLNLTGNGIDESLGYIKFTELYYKNHIHNKSYDISIKIDSLKEIPQKICFDFKKKVINRESAINRLRILYNKENTSTYITVKAIEILGKMEKSIFFRPNIELINESNPLIRSVILKVYFQNFPEKSLSLLKKRMIIENNPFVLKTLFDISKEIKDSEFHRIKEKRINQLSTIYYTIPKEVLTLLELQASYHDEIISFPFNECGNYIENILNENGLSNEWKDGIRMSWIQDRRLNVLTNHHSVCPDSIKMLKKLKHYSGMVITKSMKSLEFLETVDLSNNFLREIPNFWDELKSLKRINLNGNLLNKIPESLFKVAKQQAFIQKYVDDGVNPEEAPIISLLEILCGHELIKEKDTRSYHSCGYEIDDKGHIIGIGICDPENYRIGIIPNQISSLKHIKKLSLSSNNIRTIPESIGKLTSLKHLSLDGNYIKILPDSIGNLISLQELELGFNQLKKLPKSIGKLTSLRELDVGNNYLHELPLSFKSLDNLQYLYLGHNRLEIIPEYFYNFKKLIELDMSENKIQKISNSIISLKAIEFLGLDNNNISSIPKSIENLTNLKFLSLCNNKLSILPDFINNLPSLKQMSIGNNFFKTPPPVVEKLKQRGIKIGKGKIYCGYEYDRIS